jgi:hypothetical protein
MDAYTLVGKTYYPEGVHRDWRPKNGVRFHRKVVERPTPEERHGPKDAYTLVGKTYYPEGVSRDFRPRARQ